MREEKSGVGRTGESRKGKERGQRGWEEVRIGGEKGAGIAVAGECLGGGPGNKRGV